jgi:starvation-inducible DNA-binding protein
MSTTQALIREHDSPAVTRTDLHPQATKDVAGVMNAILADVFAL